MIKSKFVRAFILGIGLTVFSSTAAFAATDIGAGQSGVIGVEGKTVQAEPTIDSDLLQKQGEIDAYVFKTHTSEIADKGITVTHTGPMDNYVEIGITPYSEESAEYFYGIFGKDKVKVVEGQQAVLMIAPADAPDAPPVMDPDKAVSSQDEMAINTAGNLPLYATDTVTTTSAENAASAGMSSAMLVMVIAGVAVVLGGGAILVMRRLKPAGR